ncbi:MAG: DUF1295 domain-containing protein [Dyella sp.]|uniref:DUF1295 domain-containing protein n=1 Tax=Dyella sp. TaxID=1869338 RepID=UPI003F7D5765
MWRDVWWQILTVWLVTAAAMTAGWFVQYRTRNATLVDAIWTATMGLSAVFYAAVGSGSPALRGLLALLGGLWALRLFLHLLHRIRTEDEDGRYRYLRQHWQDNQAKFFAFFQAQALFTAIFSLPFLAVAANPSDGTASLMIPGTLVWLGSLYGESIADRQLARFREDPANRGRTCRAGLWRYSRHPNYFFEWTHWFAYVLLAWGSPLAWLAWLGPVLMLVSLYRVTGVPFTEAQALRSRGDDYRRYQRATSPFIPWFPKAEDRPHD